VAAVAVAASDCLTEKPAGRARMSGGDRNRASGPARLAIGLPASCGPVRSAPVRSARSLTRSTSHSAPTTDELLPEHCFTS
jgi:hypothetical protein